MGEPSVKMDTTDAPPPPPRGPPRGRIKQLEDQMGQKGNTNDAIEKIANLDVTKKTPPEPVREYCNLTEEVVDRLLKANKSVKDASIGIPKLDLLVECPDHKDQIDNNLVSGIFRISGRDIARLSIQEIKAYIDARLDNEGCGHPGCSVNLGEALESDLEGCEVPCYSCPDGALVDILTGCRVHEETKCAYLAFAAAAKYSKFYHNRGRTLYNKNFPLPYICQDGTQKYPVPMKQSLQFAYYEAAKLLKNYVQISVHTEFRDLVEALMSSDKALKEVEPGSSAITALTCS